MKFTIPIEPKTKKNSQVIRRHGNRCWLQQSDTYREYEQKCLSLIPEEVRTNIDYPVNIKATYYRASKRRVDITNLHSALHDILVKADVIVDDNFTIVIGTDGSRVLIDKDNPRTEVEITNECM